MAKEQNPRTCPKCGKKFPWGRMRCNGVPKCETVTIPYVEEEIQPEPEDLREDLKGQSDQIHDILEKSKKPLTYKQIGKKLDPSVNPKRASRIIGQMIRDGVELKREGKPRKVSIA